MRYCIQHDIVKRNSKLSNTKISHSAQLTQSGQHKEIQFYTKLNPKFQITQNLNCQTSVYQFRISNLERQNSRKKAKEKTVTLIQFQFKMIAPET